VLEPPETLRRRLFRGERQDRRWVAVLPAAVKGEVRALPEGLQHYSEDAVMEGILLAMVA